MSTFGLIRGFRSSDSTAQPLRLDKATNSIQTIDYAHHEVHGGSHYMIADVVDLTINNVRDIRITTPNVSAWAHMTLEVNVESETDMYIYEGVTVAATSTAITPINNNRNSANTSGLTVNRIDSSSVASANVSTLISLATTIAHTVIGSGKSGGLVGRDNEIILDQNNNYCVRFIANTAGNVNYAFEWYEHTDIA